MWLYIIYPILEKKLDLGFISYNILVITFMLININFNLNSISTIVVYQPFIISLEYSFNDTLICDLIRGLLLRHQYALLIYMDDYFGHMNIY